MHHIVSLLYLAGDPSFDDPDLVSDVKAVAKDWYARTSDFAYSEHLFEEPQIVLEALNRGKVRTTYKQFDDLMK
jgi:hypothetical protein